MKSEGVSKVLIVGHENLLESISDLHVDFVGGLSRSMGRNRAGTEGVNISGLCMIAWRIFRREYKHIVLPAALLVRASEKGEGRLKRNLAWLLYRLSYSEVFCGMMRGFTSFLSGGRGFVFIGRYEQSGVPRSICQFFGRSLILKTTSHREYESRDDVSIKPLNWWLSLESYPEKNMRPESAKEFDVFFAGGLTFRKRQEAPEFQKRCEQEGIYFRWEKERLDFPDFIEVLSNSLIAWSPEGSSWQCWRHYEALYYGAIPLINRPHPKIFHTFTHGETCFFYDSIKEAVEIVKGIKSGAMKLSLSQAERRNFVVENHSREAVGKILYCEMQSFSRD